MFKKYTFVGKLRVENNKYYGKIDIVSKRERGKYVSKTLLVEIRNIAIGVIILGAVQVYLLLCRQSFWFICNIRTLLGCAVAILNFALMGIILEDVCQSKRCVRTYGESVIGRLALIALAVIWATKVDYLNYVCVIIPLIFPQISIFILNLTRKKEREVSEDERT